MSPFLFTTMKYLRLGHFIKKKKNVYLFYRSEVQGAASGDGLLVESPKAVQSPKARGKEIGSISISSLSLQRHQYSVTGVLP